MKKFLEYATAVALIVLVGVIFVVFDQDRPYDSTDHQGKRSGFTIRVDALTGCHYLSLGVSSLTPRLDASGKQICTGEE